MGITWGTVLGISWRARNRGAGWDGADSGLAGSGDAAEGAAAGSGGAAGVAGTAAVRSEPSAGAIVLGGGQYVSGDAQSFSAPGGGVRLRTTLSGDWGAGAGTISLPGTTLYADAPGVTVRLLTDLAAERLVFYRGTADLNGRTVSAAGDFAAFGAAYSPDDPDWTGADTRYAYFGAAALAYYPGGGTYDGGTGLFSTAPGAVFSDLASSTITVGGTSTSTGRA